MKESKITKRLSFLLFLLWGISVSGQIPVEGLYVHLPFENSYHDFSENGNIPIQTQTTFTYDRFGCENSACYFNGSATLEFPNQARFQPLVSNSVSFWLKTSQEDRFDLVIQRTGSHDPNKDNFTIVFNHDLYGNEWSYPHYNDLNTVIRNAPIGNFNNNEWHHFVYVKDVENSKMRVYYDGDLVFQKTIIDIYFEKNGTLTIGRWVDYFFEGALDDFRVYNKALNTSEVQSLFNECTASCLEIDLGPDTSYCELFTQTLFAGDSYPNHLWSTGETTQSINISSSGTYWVYGYFDNGCSDTDSITIESFSSAGIDLGNDITLCHGESKSLYCGDCFKSYLWNTGDTTSSIIAYETGNYWVKAISLGNDTIIEDINITIQAALDFSLGKDKYYCPNIPTTEIIAENGFVSYLWNTGSTEKSISVPEGTYWISVKDQYNCTATDTITILQYPDIFSFKLFPNPASDYIILDIHTYCFPEHTIIAEVIDMNQRSVIKQEITSKITKINIPYDVKEAPYVVKLFNGKKTLVKKIIIKKSLY